MSEYTPGPWKCDERVGCVAVYPASETHECLSGADRWAVHFRMGAPVDGDWTVPEEVLANARLIASAPGLS